MQEQNWYVVMSNTIVNVVVWDQENSTWTPPVGAEMIKVEDLPGVDLWWFRVDGQWFPPEPEGQ